MMRNMNRKTATAVFFFAAFMALPVDTKNLSTDAAALVKNTQHSIGSCRKKVSHCEPILNNSTCLGATLPYHFTSTVLANDSSNQMEALGKLQLWMGLQNAPKCWEVVQPLLCSIYLPKCTSGNHTAHIELPSYNLCKITREPCKIVESTQGWPWFLQCDQKHFAPGCSETLHKIDFNLTGTCKYPFVPTENPDSYYDNIEGCGIQCHNPLFTDKEHEEVHILVGVFGSICMISTGFTLLTFLIDWKNASRYPSLVLFFINLCFFVGSVGWMAQFLPGARDEIVCRTDGTMRKSEPLINNGETASCTVVFVLVYYFMIAGLMWFIILAYTWYLTFVHMGVPRTAIEGKRGHFHLLAWTLPLVLTIACLALTEIDGDSVSGICFVGYLNHTYRGVFVLVPVGVVIVLGLGFLLTGLVKLIKMKIESPGLISDKASAKLREAIIRLGIFASLALSFSVITFVVHAYIFTNEPLWRASFEDYILCNANVTVTKNLANSTACIIKDKPNLVAMEIHILAYFGAGIVMSSWVWNSSTILTWKRFVKRVRTGQRQGNEDPVKIKKHQLIAQAFSKRRQMNNDNLSLSFHSTHNDPLGMKFDFNSVSSHDISSAWAAAIPRMIQRRGGIANPLWAQRRHSDSDLQSIQSFMTSQMSQGSQERERRESMGGQSHGSSHQSHQSHQSPHQSHTNSEQEEVKVEPPQQERGKRRRRRRQRNRVAPLIPSLITGAGDQSSTGRGTASIEHNSSLAPSSRCTSVVSSSAENPPVLSSLTRADIHAPGHSSSKNNNNNYTAHPLERRDVTKDNSKRSASPIVKNSFPTRSRPHRRAKKMRYSSEMSSPVTVESRDRSDVDARDRGDVDARDQSDVDARDRSDVDAVHSIPSVHSAFTPVMQKPNEDPPPTTAPQQQQHPKEFTAVQARTTSYSMFHGSYFPVGGEEGMPENPAGYGGTLPGMVPDTPVSAPPISAPGGGMPQNNPPLAIPYHHQQQPPNYIMPPSGYYPPYPENPYGYMPPYYPFGINPGGTDLYPQVPPYPTELSPGYPTELSPGYPDYMPAHHPNPHQSEFYPNNMGPADNINLGHNNNPPDMTNLFNFPFIKRVEPVPYKPVKYSRPSPKKTHAFVEEEPSTQITNIDTLSNSDDDDIESVTPPKRRKFAPPVKPTVAYIDMEPEPVPEPSHIVPELLCSIDQSFASSTESIIRELPANFSLFRKSPKRAYAMSSGASITSKGRQLLERLGLGGQSSGSGGRGLPLSHTDSDRGSRGAGSLQMTSITSSNATKRSALDMVELEDISDEDEF